MVSVHIPIDLQKNCMVKQKGMTKNIVKFLICSKVTAKVEIRSTTIKSFNRQTRLLKRKSSRNRAKTLLVHFNMFSVWIVHTEDNIYFSTPGALFVSLVKILNGLEQKLYDQPNYFQAIYYIDYFLS